MIQVKNIHKAFSQQQVLKGVDLEISKGCLQALIGANGAGKSSLVKIISGLSIPNNGEIYIDGEGITVDSYHYRNKVGYVFEEAMYIEKFTAEEQLYFVGKMYGIEENTLVSRVNNLLNFFELENNNKYIENFSKGMKSKVSLACALIHNPRYLVLDEPFDGIDFLFVQKISTLFRSMAIKGCTILVTSHQYDIIAEICDRFALLKDGKIYFNYTFDELLTKASEFSTQGNPVKLYLEKLMDDNPKVDKSISWLNGSDNS